MEPTSTPKRARQLAGTLTRSPAGEDAASSDEDLVDACSDATGATRNCHNANGHDAVDARVSSPARGDMESFGEDAGRRGGGQDKSSARQLAWSPPLMCDGLCKPATLVTLAFGDFGVSFASTVVGLYTRWGGPRPKVSVQGEHLIVLTRGP